MTGEQARAEVNSPTYQMAVFEEHCAILDPARLAWGLKDALVRLGVKVFEHSPVISVSTRPTSVETARGLLDAEHVVLAANAYAYAFPWLKHRLVPLYTYIVLTEPLTDTQWESVGWKNSQGIEDKRNYVHYYRPTPDGRISWGGSDGIIYFGAKAEPRHDRRASTFTRLAGTFRKTFPQLAGVKFTHAWGGPVAITADFLPAFGSLEGGKIHYGFGYCGHGVAPSNTGGQILRDLVLGRDTELANLVFVNRMPAAFPPEPIGWAGAELSRRALLRQDGKMDRGEPVGDMDPFILRILNKFS
jgi:glycine/D-amino acid oxidase-like deaminating enzyme